MAATAAEMPAAPEPTTTTSVSMSHAAAGASAASATAWEAAAARAAVAAPATKERRETTGVGALVIDELIAVVMGDGPFGLMRSRRACRTTPR